MSNRRGPKISGTLIGPAPRNGDAADPKDAPHRDVLPCQSNEITVAAGDERRGATSGNTCKAQVKQAVGGRPPRYASAPLLPLWAPKRLALPSTPWRSSSFPRRIRSHAHRCSRLTR